MLLPVIAKVDCEGQGRGWTWRCCAWLTDLDSRHDADTCVSWENKSQHLKEVPSLFSSHVNLEQTARYAGDGPREVWGLGI